MHRKPLLWIAALALAAVLGLSAQASAATVKGTVVGTDKIADLAVIRSARTNLPPVAIRTDLPRSGEVALAIGSPLGFENKYVFAMRRKEAGARTG